MLKESIEQFFVGAALQVDSNAGIGPFEGPLWVGVVVLCESRWRIAFTL